MSQSSLSKTIQAFPASFFLQSGFKTKNQGLEHLKNEIFAPVFASHKKAFDELVSQLAESIRPLYLANVNSLPEPEKSKGKKKAAPKKVQEEIVDLDEEDFSDESDEEPEPEPVKVAPKKGKAKPKA